MVPSRVSVVIVSYNTREKLRRCLSCIEAEHEIIVVDNGSADGSAAMVASEFPRTRLIENSGNVGFGAANNQGMELASREFVLFLNSDCYAHPGAIAILAAVFDDPDVIAAGGKLLNPDGSLQESVANRLTLWAVFCEQSYLEKLFPSSRLFAPYWISRRFSTSTDISENLQEQANRAGISQESPPPGPPPQKQAILRSGAIVPQVMGACLMIRPVEKFDERFFLYCEDTELCFRLSNHGRILYVPDAIFTHELGSSSIGAARWLAIARYNRGKELYFSLHCGKLASSICWLLDRSGALGRLVFYGIATLVTLGRTGNKAKLWWKVLTAPRLGPDRRPRKPR